MDWGLAPLFLETPMAEITKSKITPLAPDHEGEEVTYMPGYGDPSVTKWRGHTFKAGEPKVIKDADHIEAARGNRFFRVGKGGSAGDNPNRPPANEMEYRAHVVRWMDKEQTVEDIIKRFAGERKLREECGVGEEDLKWLSTIVEPKLRQMRMEEGLSDKQVSDLWARYGFSEQPWRG